MKKVTLLSFGLYSTIFFYSGVAMAIDKPTFTVEVKTAHYEIRNYDAMLLAEVSVNNKFEDAGEDGWKLIKPYFAGNNKPQAGTVKTTATKKAVPTVKMAYTVPFIMQEIPAEETSGAALGGLDEKSKNEFIIRYTLPKKFTLENFPEPNDPRVQVRQIPSQKVAVYTYSGSWSQALYQTKLAEFLAELNKNGVRTKGEPSFARFNHTSCPPFLRSNEIWIQVLD